MLLPSLSFAAFAALLVAGGTVACGGATETLASRSDAGAEGSPPVEPVGAPAQHRPSASACPSHANAGIPCTDSAQCTAQMPGAGPTYCTEGTCGPDACLTDTDCGSGEVCACAGAGSTGAGGYPGPGGDYASNTCVSAGCHVDADCGAGGYCSPSTAVSCGNMSGVVTYQCHRAGDACQSDSDCASSTGTGSAYCAFDPSVGAWACETSVCAG